MKRLTKSQYEAIASAIEHTASYFKTNRAPEQAAGAEAVAFQLAHELQAQDNEFNRNKFLELCGIHYERPTAK